MILHPIDALVVGVYLVAITMIGLRFSRRNHSTERYFLGGRNFPGWAMGLSFIGSTISSVTFIAYPADSFKTAWIRFLPNLAFPVIAILAAYVLVPFFRRGTVRSAYHYLSLRFGPSVCLYAALVYVLAQVVRTATITYLLSVLLGTLTGLGPLTSIAIAAGVTALYTVKGGFEAVVWTDVIQTIVLIIGAVACVLLIINAVPGGLVEIFEHARAAGKLSFRDLDVRTGLLEPVGGGFSLGQKTSAMLVLVGASQYVASQLDQHSVQRWCAARTTREARKSMYVLGLGAVPIWATFMFLGTALWVYYQARPDDVSMGILEGRRRAEDILPHFIVTTLPPGAAGLVIASAIAAAMGSLSSSISAAGMVWVNDIYRPRISPDRDDAHYLRASRWTSLAISTGMMVGAYLFHIANSKTMMDVSIIATALFSGGISGAFLFGLLTRRGDHRAVLIGIVATALFTIYAFLSQFGVAPRWFDPYYTAILGNLVMFGACWLASVFLPAPPRDLTNLTFWDREEEPPSADPTPSPVETATRPA
jgi:SSS family solute:Na+ symporter